MKLRKLISFGICILLVISFSLPAFASNNGRNASFKDVQKGYWAYDQIMWMLQKNIINGTGNGYFSPEGIVTRSQFAKMMVLTLNLQLYYPETPSFLDIGKKAWEYPYVESAKTYLTGFRTSQGDYFKPSQPAVREDMAVALVKALGYQNETADESVLNRFADAGQISPNLRKYIALSVKHNLVEGYTDNGRTIFNPQGNLTRAQASTLLYKAFKSNEDKVTYDEDKVTYDDSVYNKPSISVSTEDNKLVVRWNKINSSQLKGYMVIISKNDDTPTYPENGFLYYYTDVNRTYAVIDNRTAYNGNSDFGQYLAKDQAYYFTVAAVYDDRNVTGNTVRYVYPGNGDEHYYPAPVVYTVIENGNLVIRWSRIASEKLQNYRVVISKNKSAPKYPEDGYLYKITDRNRTFAVINNEDKYNNGDFGDYLTKGEKYYFSVTAVYNDRTVAGNAILCQYDGNDNPQSYFRPVLNASDENGRTVLRWNRIDSPNLEGYRVVVSKNDSSPNYPENGYLYWITDRSKTYAVLESNTAYTGGDFGGYLIKGEKYYFSITAVYKDKNVTSNVVHYVYNGDDNPVLFPAPVVSTAYEDGKMIVKWNKIDSPQLVEYRLVISQNSQAPAYPANGYYNAAIDKNTTSAAIDISKPYNNGDFKTLTDGTEYYFSVTAVYNNEKYRPGNTVKVLFVLPPKQ